MSGVVYGPVPRKIQQVEKSVSIKIMNYKLPSQFCQVLHNWYSKFCSLSPVEFTLHQTTVLIQMTQEVNSSWRAGCVMFLFFIPFSQRGQFGREGPFYWPCERGGTILFIYFVQKYASCWLEFHFMVYALLEGQQSRTLDQVILSVKQYYWETRIHWIRAYIVLTIQFFISSLFSAHLYVLHLQPYFFSCHGKLDEPDLKLTSIITSAAALRCLKQSVHSNCSQQAHSN